ncbi:MAG: biotin transporter BioY [Beijerinckiaceae bacterium]|nr:biotin transporter BioY [Beijerinckiaceae bacterium]
MRETKQGQARIEPATLSASFWPVEANVSLIRGVILALVGTVLLAISAKVQVPFYPVPLTMQTFVVLVLGAAYGPALGAATIALYLAEGLFLNAPVFAGSTAGLAYLASPTIGYLLAYLPAATFVGFLARRGWDRSPVSAILMMAGGAAIILVTGFVWLGHVIGAERALVVGVYPFLPGDLLKLLLAAATLPLAWKLVRR